MMELKDLYKHLFFMYNEVMPIHSRTDNCF